jgi:hypothetical protein
MDMRDIINLAVSIFGGFFVAAVLFHKVWRGKVTLLKLAGFTFAYSASFFGLMYVIQTYFMSLEFIR